MLLNEFIVMPQSNVNPWAFLLWRVSEITFCKLPRKGGKKLRWYQQMLSLLSGCLPTPNCARNLGDCSPFGIFNVHRYKNIYSNIPFLKVAPGKRCGRAGLRLGFCPQRLGGSSVRKYDRSLINSPALPLANARSQGGTWLKVRALEFVSCLGLCSSSL